jgi:hypothetical protein
MPVDFGYEFFVSDHHVARRSVLQYLEIHHAHVFALFPTTVCFFADRNNLACDNRSSPEQTSRAGALRVHLGANVGRGLAMLREAVAAAL